jgi:hypothetical protein
MVNMWGTGPKRAACQNIDLYLFIYQGLRFAYSQSIYLIYVLSNDSFNILDYILYSIVL